MGGCEIWHSSKYRHVYSAKQRHVFMFVTIWGGVNDDWIFIYPFKFYRFCPLQTLSSVESVSTYFQTNFMVSVWLAPTHLGLISTHQPAELFSFYKVPMALIWANNRCGMWESVFDMKDEQKTQEISWDCGKQFCSASRTQ